MALPNNSGVVLYAIVLMFYAFSLKSSADIGKNKLSANVEDIPDEIKALGRFKYHFFTIWTYVLQTVFLVTAFLDELSKILNLPLPVQKQLGRTRAFLFNTFVFPCSLLVVTTFWTLWHIDRELIFPKVLDTFYPVWLNHAMHTFILIPLLIELTLPKRYNFVKFKNAVIILTIYMAVYQGLYFSVYLRYGVWLYGVYGALDWTQRILFTLFKFFLSIAYLQIGIAIQDKKKVKHIRKKA